MSNESDSGTDGTDDIDAIRERKKRELKTQRSDAGSPEEPIHVEDRAHFDEITEAGVVLVDFYADWCGPCTMLEPTVETIAAETEAAVAKVDVDQHQALASEFGVQGVPTLVLFADGERVEKLVGVQEQATLVELISEHTETV